MGVTETVPAPETATTPAAPPPQTAPGPFLAARPRDARVEALLAFALAAEAGEGASPDTVARRGAEAERLLTEHAHKLLHNHLGEIRREAVAEHMAALRPPLGFWGVAGACLAAVALVALGALWLVAHPAALAAALSLLGG